jgi:hypothetical protein
MVEERCALHEHRILFSNGFFEFNFYAPNNPHVLDVKVQEGIQQ